ncbi:hypothetical protein RRG08_045769 [Elysia crispata]|uniref:DNA-directed DNA polymerase n=1 Tax=Elysia crispata TaxID=231223 RepID=A0AAE1AZI4_9GAST|nr:hypothetical protein RRG08_045769 [Elysia crispata]
MQNIFGLRAPSYRSEDGLAGLGVRRGTRFSNAKRLGYGESRLNRTRNKKSHPRGRLIPPAGLGWGVKHRNLVMPTHPYPTIAPRSARPRASTGVELELLTDYDQHLFIEKGMRGGISMVSKRHARANNPAVEGYDSEKPNSHILYLDANNLYGWAMSQPLPTGGFRWVEDCTALAGTIQDQPADGPEGFILEVDLEYPQELHDRHNAYPLAPERMVVQKEWMSEYQHGLLGKGMASAEVEKLVPSLRDKNHYVLHYRNLQLFLGLGLQLRKVHRALRFDQSPWMEPYIRMNTELRKQATSAFEKDLYKLANNSVFGKTMENLRKRVDVKLVRSNEEDKLRRLLASPSFARANIFDDDLAAVEVHKSRMVLSRPVYVGGTSLTFAGTPLAFAGTPRAFAGTPLAFAGMPRAFADTTRKSQRQPIAD